MRTHISVNLKVHIGLLYRNIYHLTQFVLGRRTRFQYVFLIYFSFVQKGWRSFARPVVLLGPFGSSRLTCFVHCSNFNLLFCSLFGSLHHIYNLHIQAVFLEMVPSSNNIPVLHLVPNVCTYRRDIDKNLCLCIVPGNPCKGDEVCRFSLKI